jgi:hypothetical protein
MERKKRERCVFTIMNNEYDFFPIWLNYYSKFFDPQDIYVLDHNSEGEFFEQVQQLSREGKFNLQRVYNYALFDHAWLQSTVCDFQRFLLNSYNSTLFIEIDEIVATDPNSQFKNIGEYMDAFNKSGLKAVRADGYNVVSNPDKDAPIDPNIPILQQRTRYKWDLAYCKPYIASIPLDYINGFHTTISEQIATGERFGIKEYLIDKQLITLHLHCIDINWTHQKNHRRSKDKWCTHDWEAGEGFHNKPKTLQSEKDYFLSFYYDSHKIPESLRDIV